MLPIIQVAAIKHVNLTNVGHVKDAIKVDISDSRLRLLPGLPGRTLQSGLAIFHEACRQRPETFARLNGALTQQHLTFKDRHAADNDMGITIMDKLAAATDKPLAVVSSRDFKDDRVTAAGTEFHRGLTHLMQAAQYKGLTEQ